MSKSRAARAVASSRITGKGQATVPASVRRKLHLKTGDTVMFGIRERNNTNPEG